MVCDLRSARRAACGAICDLRVRDLRSARACVRAARSAAVRACGAICAICDLRSARACVWRDLRSAICDLRVRACGAMAKDREKEKRRRRRAQLAAAAAAAGSASAGDGGGSGGGGGDNVATPRARGRVAVGTLKQRVDAADKRYRDKKRAASTEQRAPSSAPPHKSRKSVLGDGNASAVRLSRAASETAKTLGQWSPGSQGAVLHALKSKEETREAMQAFAAEIADTQVYAEIGERLVLSFLDLGGIAGRLTSGSARERNTARKLRQLLLASLVVEEDGPAAAAVRSMLDKLEVSKTTWQAARARRARWLDEEKRKKRSDSKRDCPALAELVVRVWERKAYPSPVAKHGHRKKGRSKEDRKQVHDLHLVIV
eukprot:SAG31_NODE_267_length_18790_cov_3.661655_13_plen_372_part_00